MAMKLKLNDEGSVVVQDGKPVYVSEDGKELAVDVEQLFSKVTELNNESKGHRIKAKELEDKLSQFGDVEPGDIEQFLDTIDGLGGIDNIVTVMKNTDKVDIEAIKSQITGIYEGKLSEATGKAQSLEQQIYQLLVSNNFTGSKFVNDRLLLPPDIAEATFGKHFKVEDGKVVAYMGDHKILSMERPGELATFDEAMSEIVKQYPMKDRILKGTNASGSGAPIGGNTGNYGSVRSRSDLKTDAEKAKFIGDNGLEAFKQLPQA